MLTPLTHLDANDTRTRTAGTTDLFAERDGLPIDEFMPPAELAPVLPHSTVPLNPAAHNGYVYDLDLSPFAAAGPPLAAVVVALSLAARPRPAAPDQPDVAR
ncbi:hypothetical protein Dvina_53080 [Dactylosporangium vinaceum]|uniref:Uncharacterized protein n=1 Tax=Dactylosporangium vinaceum TaxID=53362 RepID=A0ABV5MQ72_9ACTN|nr:hypothetical protein [Dactylosporangium vinaceum]UAB96544.1 hypothetical protein Dvina_53080 [Dactylosporangium vinaceum]